MISKVLIITGMHRSGTSLVSKYLHQCGLNIGDNLIEFESVTSNSAYNGHHEDKVFLDFHQRLLEKSAVIPLKNRNYGFPTSRFHLPVRISKQYQAEADRMISERSHLHQWGWKDPRTTLFLDFWQQRIDEPKFLLLFRNPLAVTDSVIRRGTDKVILNNPIIAIKAWILFNQKILNFWQKHNDKCVVFNIEDIVDHPDSLTESLSNKFDLELDIVDFANVYCKESLVKDTINSLDYEKIRKKHAKLMSKSDLIYDSLQRISEHCLVGFKKRL